ncbi:MAG: cytochrome c biogenesis CcdA family protein [Thermodesulfobacteriota bacterium]
MRKLSIFFFVFFLFSLPICAIAQPTPPVQIYFFYTEDCQACQLILQNYLPTLKTMVPNIEIKSFDAGNPIYYEALSKLEKRFGRTTNELPIVFVGDQMLAGEMEIMEKLNPLLLEIQAKGGASPPPLEIPSTAKPSSKSFTVDLVYFYQKGCPKCDRANALLKYLAKKYPQLKIKEIDLHTPDGKRFNETLCSRLDVSPEKRLIAPSIFIGKDYLLPDQITEPKVDALIQKYGEKSASVSVSESKPTFITPPPAPSLAPTPEETKKAEQSIIQRFKSLGILTIVSAGLLDGINPCAFATLIFFISYLSFVGRKRSEIFYVGMGYSGAVFITYLLIGIGILTFIQHLSFLPLFSRIVYILTIVFALILGILSLYDFIQLKRGRASEMKLQLPDFLKKRIHQAIRKESKSTRYFIAAISAGFVVSLLEFTCTGQVYLPTILFVTNIPSLKTSAVSYLLLYNFMFIVPLLIIFGIVYWGVTSEQLALFLQKRASSIKLYTSLLFFALAGILILSLM